MEVLDPEVNEMINKTITQVVNDTIAKVSKEAAVVIMGTAEKVTEEYIKAIKEENLIMEDPKKLYRKTELLLYSYPKLKESEEEHKERIEELEIYGTRKKSHSIANMGSGSFDNRSELERVEDQIEAVNGQIQDTEYLIEKIEIGLSKIKDDPFYFIITEHYFENKTYKSISQTHYKYPEETIRKHKTRLIKVLEAKYFISDYVDNLLIQIGLLGFEEKLLKGGNIYDR